MGFGFFAFGCLWFEKYGASTVLLRMSAGSDDDALMKGKNCAGDAAEDDHDAGDNTPLQTECDGD